MRATLLGGLVWALAPVAPVALGQDLEPRRWTHLPIGLNVIGGAYGYTEGDLAFDPVLQIENARVENNLLALSYVRSFQLAGRSARVDVLLPYSDAYWSGQLEGAPASRRQDGLADPRLRLSVNLVGAPPLKGKEFMDFRRAHPTYTTVGAALSVRIPVGQYDEERLLNLGQNRFVFRPQLGVLHTSGPWSYELTGSIYLFTNNNDFFGGNELQQDPVYALQAHVVRTFGRGWWVAGGAGYGLGGEAEVNGINKDNHKGDFLAGASFGVPITLNQGLRLSYLRSRTNEDVGADTDSLLVGWSMRF